jgi:hypothetical protein
MTKENNDGPADAEFEEMFRGMLKRDVVRLNDAMSDNPEARDTKVYRENLKYITEVLALPSPDFLDFVSREVCTAPPGSFWDIGPKWVH